MDTSIDLNTLITIMGGTFGVTTAVIAILVRMLLKGNREKVKNQLEALQADYMTRFQVCFKEITDAVTDRKECEVRKDKDIDRLDALCGKLQDQWLAFQKSTASLEATRGRKLDALFNVMDKQKDEIRVIRSYLQQLNTGAQSGRET